MIHLTESEFMELPEGTQIQFPYDPRNPTISHPKDNLPREILDYKCITALRTLNREYSIELKDAEIVITFK